MEVPTHLKGMANAESAVAPKRTMLVMRTIIGSAIGIVCSDWGG